MLIRVVDFETTGVPPDAAVCEVGWTDVACDDFDWSIVGGPVGIITNPGRPMPPEARAVHHISDADCAGAPQATTAYMRLMDGADVFAAHSAAFEREFFTGGDKPWICTFKCARRAWIELPAFGNQFLRYHLGLELDHALAMPPHRAAPDTFVTAHILGELLNITTVEQLVAWSRMPIYYHRVPMTHAKGKLWSEIDWGLLKWFLNQDHVEPDVKAAARSEMQRRSERR